MRLSQKLESFDAYTPPYLLPSCAEVRLLQQGPGTGILTEQSCGFVPVTAVCLVKVCCVRSYPVIVIES